ncbi:hypothetical protein KBJ98_13635 [Flavobacterium sp. F-328]|uniref:Uncharacterized protein n=1 Tax=Flavobacterium erciyesense TaxID=2825842 RepID=A0ABS5D6V6_9FLAO|nr:hypothetical protein [Flavobacterium erciyesense]MBQ0909750.1 hypothetical protein [Flavobacterium erciyesense]
METPIYTKHTLEELVNAYSEVKGDAEFANYFIEQYNQAFKVYTGNVDEEGTPAERALNFCFKYYMPILLQQLDKGHSAKWAHEFASSSQIEEDVIISEAYDEIKKNDTLWAQNELIILCKSLGITDPMQVNYYINLIDIGVLSEKAVHRSKAYIDIFNKELAKGKSFLYSQVYANEKAAGFYSEVYCRAYAWAFEETVLKSKSESFRYIFTCNFAEIIAENYHDLEQAMNDDDFYFYVNPIIASAQATDFIETHEVENPEKFRTLYVDIFEKINTLDQSPLLQIEKDIDEEVLKLTLEKLKK